MERRHEGRRNRTRDVCPTCGGAGKPHRPSTQALGGISGRIPIIYFLGTPPGASADHPMFIVMFATALALSAPREREPPR